MPDTTYEMLAREKIWRVLAAALRESGVSAGSAKRMADADWLYFAGLVRCKYPSQATKDLVIRLLGEDRA